MYIFRCYFHFYVFIYFFAQIPEGQLLGIDSIFGGAKVAQEADNILILQVKEGKTISQAKKALQVIINNIYVCDVVQFFP